MPKRHSLNVSLTPELVGFITAQDESGRYQTASEVVRAGLRLLEQADPVLPAKVHRRARPRSSGAADARA